MIDPNLPIRLDLEEAIACLQEALNIANDLNGSHVKVDDPKKSSPYFAKLNARLRFISDLCRTASAEADMLYWKVKGNTDPRDRE